MHRKGRDARPGVGGAKRAGPKMPAALMSEIGQTQGVKDRKYEKPHFRKPAPSRRVIGGQPDPVASSSQPPRRKRPQEATTSEVNPPLKKKRKELSLPNQTSEDAEDKEIEWLEYMLKKEKAASVDVLDDGLDELLYFADLIGPTGDGLDPKGGLSDLEDEDDNESDGAVGDSEEEDEESEVLEEADEGGADETDDEGEGSEDRHQKDRTVSVAISKPASTSTSTYIPPHLRAAKLAESSSSDEAKRMERLKLERKVQGLLNKLSEANMESILKEFDQLYNDHSRNEMSTIISDLILTMVGDKAHLLDSFVLLYATFVGALHRMIGMEFGARFVQGLIAKYDSSSTSPPIISEQTSSNIYETSDHTKTPLNLLNLIAGLYNAQVVSANLIFDFVRAFLEVSASDDQVMGELEVESLLKLMKGCGQQLRSDDSAALKDIISAVQVKTKGKEKLMTTRAKFMVETIGDLRGGKSKNQSGQQEAIAKMRKFLAAISRKRQNVGSEPLRASLSDLRQADTRGQWWITGAGWSGNPLVEREKRLQEEKPKKVESVVEDEERLLQAARQQGMNTDIRRTIFVTLMTSEDFVHACDRLSHLKFTEVQQREFVRVALHCSSTEKQYNPYYTLVLNQLCTSSHAHRFTLQYALWDLIRDLDVVKSKRKGENVAKVMAYIIARGTMDLTTFKAIDFTSLKISGLKFFAAFLANLFISIQTLSPLFKLPKSYAIAKFDDEGVEEVFEKALSNGELAQGLQYILSRKLKSDDVFASGELERAVIRKGRVIASSILSRAI